MRKLWTIWIMAKSQIMEENLDDKDKSNIRLWFYNFNVSLIAFVMVSSVLWVSSVLCYGKFCTPYFSIFTFIGISAVFFRTLLGYFGQQTFYWFNLLLIYGTSMSASAIAKLTSDDIRMLLLVDSIFVVAILIVFIFVLLILIEKIKFKQLKILILEYCI